MLSVFASNLIVHDPDTLFSNVNDCSLWTFQGYFAFAEKKIIFTDNLRLLILRFIILNLLQMVNFPYQENICEFTVHNFDYHRKKKANMQHLSFLHK